MFLKISSAACERFSDDRFGLVLNFTGNFVSIIFFRTFVFRSLDFFRVIDLSLGSMSNFLIVLKTFLSM